MRNRIVLVALASLALACGRLLPETFFGKPLQSAGAQSGAVDPIVAHYFNTATVANTAVQNIQIANAQSAFVATFTDGGFDADAGH